MQHQSIRAVVYLLSALTLGFGCGDDSDTETAHHPVVGDRDSGVDAMSADDDASGDGDSCEGEKDGAACGGGRYCIDALCTFNRCGDGVVLEGEECDDGNEAFGDGCDPACKTVSPKCGDGIVQDGEECDDGNWFDADECTTSCMLNECGNERLDGVEECDDGNEVNDDDCSNACTENVCRNGRVDPGEECDDGNRIHGDECSNACEIVKCGNGDVEGYEECDDGNQVDTDGCSNTCTENECGNVRIDPGELCDGDLVDDDGNVIVCADDCLSIGEDLCTPCETAEGHCRTYTEDLLDPYAGCFEAVNTDFGAAADPMLLQECMDVVYCARKHDCWFGLEPGLNPIGCYCGSWNPSDCATMGPAEDAACAEEWLKAARATTNAEVIARTSSLANPLGWARLLLECDLTFCATECGATE